MSHISQPALPSMRIRPSLLPQLTRAWSLPTSVLPAAAGGVVAIGDHRARWWLLPVALVAMLVLHAAVNVSNDVEDAARKMDPPDKLRNSGLFNNERLTIAQGRQFYGGCIALTIALGVLICAVQGPALLVVGVAGVLGGLLYTAGPLPYKYLGLGEVLIVWLMGPLITLGAFTAVTGRFFGAAAFWVGLGPGFLITAVLAANNLTDLPTDRSAGARTAAVRLGFDRARALYLGLVAATLLTPVVLWAAGLFGASILLALLAAPPLAGCARIALGAHGEDDEGLGPLTEKTGQAHLLYSLLLIAGIILDRA